MQQVKLNQNRQIVVAAHSRCRAAPGRTSPTQELNIRPAAFPEDCEALREEVRTFTAQTLDGYRVSKRVGNWNGNDPEFSRKRAERDCIGMGKHDSGSDLASIRTKAARTEEGGINGSKLGLRVRSARTK